MFRILVESSNIYSVGYDDETKIMEIEFMNSGLYEFYSVPVEKYTGLLEAESIGSFFNTEIKGKYEYAKKE